MTALTWLRRESALVDPPPPAEPTAWPQLAELQVYTRTGRVLGWIATEGERTSDWMNQNHELELLGPVAVDLAQAAVDLPPASPNARHLSVSATDILFAVPPELPSKRHLRLHRRVIRVHFEMDGYDLRGRIHVRPGAEVGDYLLRSSRVFVPITDAEVRHLEAPEFTRTLPVIVVNSRHVTRLHLVEGSGPPASTAAASSAAGSEPAWPAMPATPIFVAPILETEQPDGSATDESEGSETSAGAVHRALGELAAMRRDELISAREFAVKRREILARL